MTSKLLSGYLFFEEWGGQVASLFCSKGRNVDQNRSYFVQTEIRITRQKIDLIFFFHQKHICYNAPTLQGCVAKYSSSILPNYTQKKSHLLERFGHPFQFASILAREDADEDRVQMRAPPPYPSIYPAPTSPFRFSIRPDDSKNWFGC